MRQALAFGAMTLAAVMAAQEGVTAEQKEFTHTFSLGATFTDGNSDTRQGNVTYLAEGENEGLGSIRMGVEGNYGESRSSDGEMDKTVENAKLFANAKKTLSAMTFAYVDTTYVYDDVALIDYRFTLGPGFGFYLVKNDTTQVSMETGPSYVWERVDGETDQYPALRVAERAEHKLSATARLWESVEYLPNTEKFSDYLLNSEAGAEAALNAKLNLRLVVQNKYDSDPALGKEKSDTTFIAGLSVKL